MKRVRILPVYPKFPVSFWSFKYALDFIDIPAQMPPLGLATVAAMFPEEHFDIQRIIDLNTEPLTEEHLNNTDLVITSSMLVQRDSLEEIIEKAHSHGKKVVAGGPYPTSYREEVNADYLVLQEAEASLPPFIRDLLKGDIKRIYDESDGNYNGKPMLNNTPNPRWDLIDVKKYSTMAVQYSRGCPFDCEFCDITNLFGRNPRTKTTEQITGELDAIYNTGWRGPIFMVDDNFIGNKKEVRKLLPEIKSWQDSHYYPFSFFTETGIELGAQNHADILKGMAEAGFDQVFLGIESTDTDVLKRMNKKQNTNIYEKIRNIQRAGLEVMGGFIIGGDGEKPEVFENIFKFIQEAGIVIPMAGLLIAPKNTKLYNRLAAEGRLRGDSSGNNTHNLNFNFKPELDESFLIRGYVNLLEKLFDSKNFYDRCRNLRDNRGQYKAATPVNKRNIKAFRRIMYQNLIRKPDYHFLKYTIETALTNPKKFPDAISHAAKLHHLKTMTRAMADVYQYREVAESIYKKFQRKVGRIGERFSDNAEIQIEKLQRISHDMLDKATRRYNRIHDDFRDDAKQILENLSYRIESYIQNYKLELKGAV